VRSRGALHSACCCLLMCAAVATVIAAECDIRVPYRVVLHVHSSFSPKGSISLERISELASSRGIDALIMSDDALTSWTYGLWPFRRLISTTISLPAVLSIGITRYLAEIRRVNELSRECLLIPGLEIAPYYTWSGNPVRELLLDHANKDLVVAGLSTAAAWDRLPAINNPHSRRVRLRSLLFLFWPAALIILGIAILWHGRGRVARIAAGVICLIAGGAFAIQYYPYTVYPFSPFRTDAGEQPYQLLIDYVRQHDGIVIWSGPEATNFLEGVRYGRVVVRTRPYPDALINTTGYTGFAYFYEGFREVGVPGGVWDQLLDAYCRGERAEPVWAFGEADWVGDTAPDTRLGVVDQLVEARAQTSSAILDALKRGQFCARLNKNGMLVLRDMTLSTAGARASMGGMVDGVVPQSTVVLRGSIEDAAGKNPQAEVLVIKNTKIVLRQSYDLPVDFVYQDTQSAGRPMDYYRVEVRAPHGAWLVSNPFFARQ